MLNLYLYFFLYFFFLNAFVAFLVVMPFAEATVEPQWGGVFVRTISDPVFWLAAMVCVVAALATLL